jgi:agmatine deiminase
MEDTATRQQPGADDRAAHDHTRQAVTATLSSTPAEDRFRMPAEWEPHDGCWMIWPERPDNWRLGGKPAQAAFAQVAHAIQASEHVTMAVSAGQFDHCRSMLDDAIEVVEMSSNDAWIRDTGPTFVIDDHGRRRGIHWHFNAWGGLEDGLYFPWDDDEHVAPKVLEIEHADRYRAPIVLEGGSIHVDGQGTVLATEECLLNHDRNPDLTREQIERTVCAYLGATKVIWLKAGVYRDETHGHVDNLACFIRPGVVALDWTGDPNDPQHAISKDALRRLQRATDAHGRTIEIIRLPSPGPVLITDAESREVDAVEGTLPRRPGDRLAASYVNYYLGNSRVVLPLLDERHDDEAREILSGCFPDREVIGVPAHEILLGGGNIHCITQQVPAALTLEQRPAPGDAQRGRADAVAPSALHHAPRAASRGGSHLAS